MLQIMSFYALFAGLMGAIAAALGRHGGRARTADPGAAAGDAGHGAGAHDRQVARPSAAST